MISGSSESRGQAIDYFGLEHLALEVINEHYIRPWLAGAIAAILLSNILCFPFFLPSIPLTEPVRPKCCDIPVVISVGMSWPQADPHFGPLAGP